VTDSSSNSSNASSGDGSRIFILPSYVRARRRVLAPSVAPPPAWRLANSQPLFVEMTRQTISGHIVKGKPLLFVRI
jgi:hypothetical protein